MSWIRSLTSPSSSPTTTSTRTIWSTTGSSTLREPGDRRSLRNASKRSSSNSNLTSRTNSRRQSSQERTQRMWMMRMTGMREEAPESTMGWATQMSVGSTMTRPWGCRRLARTGSMYCSSHSLPGLSLAAHLLQYRNMGGISRRQRLITRKKRLRSQLRYKSSQMRRVKTRLRLVEQGLSMMTISMT